MVISGHGFNPRSRQQFLFYFVSLINYFCNEIVIFLSRIIS